MLLLAASTALAQEAPPDLPDPGSETVPIGAPAGEAPPGDLPQEEVPGGPTPAPDRFPPPDVERGLGLGALAADRVWTPIGADGMEHVSDVSVHLDRPEIWAAATLDGAVWITLDDGASWRRTLAGLALSSKDEEAMLQVQARIQELVSQVETPTEDAFESNGWIDEEAYTQAVEDAADQARQLAAQAVAEIQTELDAGAWFLEQQAVVEGGRDRARPRVQFTRLGLLIEARADGLRVSEDLGASWELVVDQAVTAFAERPDGTYVIGLADGLMVSADLRRWERVDALQGTRVTDVVSAGPLYVSTVDGLWTTEDGHGWAPSSTWTDEVYTARPGTDGALLLGTEDTVRRTPDPTMLATASAGGPLPQVTTLAAAPDGSLLAASSAGPWLSTDGGRSWTSLELGAEETRQALDVEVRDRRVLLATASGLFRLDPGRAEEEAPRSDVVEWIPLGALLDLSLGRPELTAHTGRRWVAGVLPELSVDGTWNEDVADRWDADTWTVHSLDSWWQVHMALTWRPGRQRQANSFDAADFGTDDVSVVVVDGEVVLDDGTSTAVIGSAVRRGSVLYRGELTEQISELWTTRQRLVTEEREAKGLSLPDQVRRRLRILEVEARLDALTNGAVSSWEPVTPGGSR